MAWQDNPITRNFEGTAYVVRETAESFPYAVVPKTIDPDNKYDFDTVADFWASLPEGDSRKLQAGETPLPPAPTDEEKLDAYESQVSAYLNNFVKQRKYVDAADCVSYMHSRRGQKYVEAAYVMVAREAVWETWHSLRREVEAGTSPMPDTWAAVLESLPTLVWPEDYVDTTGDLAARDMADRIISRDAGNRLATGTDSLLFIKDA